MTHRIKAYLAEKGLGFEVFVDGFTGRTQALVTCEVNGGVAAEPIVPDEAWYLSQSLPLRELDAAADRLQNRVTSAAWI